MKHRFYLLLILLAATLGVQAKDYVSRDGGHMLRGFGQERYSLSLMAEYGYNRSWEHMGNVDIYAHMPVVKNVQLDARVQYQSANVLTGAVVVRPTFDLPVGQLFLETELLYKAVMRDRMSDMCAAISLGWRFDYVSVQIGGFGRVMDTWNRDWHSEDKYQTEPFNLLYRLEVFARPQVNNWNISLALSNIDDWQMERMWQPLFMLNSRYDIDDHWRVHLEAETKITGMFHLNATFYAANVRAGFSYRF